MWLEYEKTVERLGEKTLKEKKLGGRRVVGGVSRYESGDKDSEIWEADLPEYVKVPKLRWLYNS